MNHVAQEMTALAEALKTRRAGKALRNAVRRGQGPTLSLSAAISASLVSAAAHENEIDPLAGLVAVDDLSAFAEGCLPGGDYESEAGHDHEPSISGRDHAGHQSGAFYLDDPFASPFANTYAHHEEGHAYHAAGFVESSSHSSHDHSATAIAVQGKADHSLTGGHNHHESAPHHSGSAGAAHTGHHAAAKQINSGHVAHASASIAHESHSAATVAHAGHSVPNAAAHPHAEKHATAQVSGSGAEQHHDHGAAIETDHNLDDAIDALASPGEAASENDPPHPPPLLDVHHHEHGVTLAALDIPPVDDLAAATPPLI